MWTYTGDRFLTYPEIQSFCREAAAALPRWARVVEFGTSRLGTPVVGLVVGDHSGEVRSRPAFWLDGGTHAGEWLGVCAAVYTLSGWLTRLSQGDAALQAWFARHTAIVLPCISPDGMQALLDGAPFLRSTLRPPRDGRPRVGLEPSDLDGDGRVRWMRWRHPTGSAVFDDPTSAVLRPRTLDDDPADAWHVCSEGHFLAWDGHRWEMASLRHGLDLNRNFPGSWTPFEMFGMDGGDFPLSEPESRNVVDTFRSWPRVVAGLTNHTYTGALLTQPYRQPSPLGAGDVRLMETLGRQLLAGTGWRCVRTHPDFTYDPDKAIVGVWSDTMSTTFGVPGYTLELWDPFAFAGVENPRPGDFWAKPDPAACARLVTAFVGEAGAIAPWVPFDHPQLGPVELGGLDLVRTLHNPPVRLLAEECEKGARVADRLLRALPDVHAELEVENLGPGLRRVCLRLENRGFLPSSGLSRAETIGLAPPITACIDHPVVGGTTERQVGWLDGWGDHAADLHPVYPSLPGDRSCRTSTTWIVRGEGPITVRWDAGRGGTGSLRAG